MTAGLSNDADASFDRFARLIKDALGVPVALVTVVEADRQVFPGAAGLDEPLDTERATPLSHSFCQYVVRDQEPLIVTDARLDPRVSTNPAIEDLGVTAYAGFPLRLPGQRAFGSVCAIDTEPREWTDGELRMLSDIAELCSTELELRDARARETDAARAAREATARSQALLRLSERLAEAVTVGAVVSRVHEAAHDQLGCSEAGLWTVSANQLVHIANPAQPWPEAERREPFAFDLGNPIGAALVGRTALYYAERSSQDAAFAECANADPAAQGARVFVPLLIGDEAIGTLLLVWPERHEWTLLERVTIAALTSYSAQALSRARLIAERTSAAATLQHALLSELPQPDSLELAARYRTAAAHDEVGGDWYDAVVMPSGATNLVIGDVAGHDLTAAATMGSLRSLLRAFAWAIDDPPSTNVQRLDQAARDLELSACATLVFARIEQSEEDRAAGVRTLLWTNAGHPPPILVTADGHTSVLDDGAAADSMLGVVPDRPRRDQRRSVPPGSTLLLYTDGLVERRTVSDDEMHERLLGCLSRHAALPVDKILDAVLEDLVGANEDDVALLAVRFQPEG